MKVRLQKHLAAAGVGSRRTCEEIILEGRVRVDGEVATLGTSVDPDSEVVTVDGAPLQVEAKEYWVLNKPVGLLSAAADDRGRVTVREMVPTETRVYPVGRLDLDSSGVLLLTNDGTLTERLLHPRYHVDKEYLVTVRGPVDSGALERIRKGVRLEEGLTSPAQVAVVSAPTARKGGNSIIRVIIHEGRKRQVRRMFASVGSTVQSLHRTRFANLTDAGLALGQARRLTEQEIAALYRLAGLL